MILVFENTVAVKPCCIGYVQYRKCIGFLKTKSQISTTRIGLWEFEENFPCV